MGQIILEVEELATFLLDEVDVMENGILLEKVDANTAGNPTGTGELIFADEASMQAAANVIDGQIIDGRTISAHELRLLYNPYSTRGGPTTVRSSEVKVNDSRPKSRSICEPAECMGEYGELPTHTRQVATKARYSPVPCELPRKSPDRQGGGISKTPPPSLWISL
ncbi:hypothetical protein KSP39_PZI010693 [Platanthera zijinensis]|uniref:RRM domain-containing protein n=1 Tax=Platanthera zijinensis TaxID=2320716 RepID=A0AAP0BJ21_9ASPA